MNTGEYRRALLRDILVGLGALLAGGGILVGGLAVNTLSGQLPTVVAHEMQLTRDDLSAQLLETRVELAHQLTTLNVNLVKESAAYRKTLQSESEAYRQLINQDWYNTVVALNETINDRLNDTNLVLAASASRALDQTEPVLANVQEVATNLDAITIRLNTQEPMVYSRFLATTGELNKTLDALRRVSNEVAKVAPEVSQDLAHITKSAAETSHNVAEYTKPRGFVRGFLGPIVGGVFKILF